MPSKKLVFALILVIMYWGYDTVVNANRKYSSESYWASATVSDVAEVPDEMLLPGNKYGSVLMYAAYVNTDPKVLKELIRRGADVNEVEKNFKGTPLSAAASNNSNPEIISFLVKNGARVNATISMGRTSLMNAAVYNHNKGIVRALIINGANKEIKDELGLTALDYARQENNTTAIEELTAVN